MKQRALRKTEQWLPVFVLALFVAQPLLDVLSYWLNEFQLSNTPTLLLRFAILLAVTVVGYSCSERRRAYSGLLAVALALGVGHVIACVSVGYDAPAQDIINYVRVMQIPLFTMCMISVIRKNRACYRAIELGYMFNFVIIIAVELLSTLTGTDPHTYAHKGIGVLGWFATTNSQSAILCALAPIVLLLAIRKNRPLPLLAAIVATCGALFFFATRLAYFAIFIIAAGMVLVLLLSRRMNRRAAALLLAGAVVCGAGYSVSPMHQYRYAQQELEQQMQKKADETIAQLETQYGVTAEEEPERILVPVYEEFVGELMDRFGEQRVLEAYDYTTNVTELKDTRRGKKLFCVFLQEESGVLAVLFGMERADMIYEDVVFDAENDFHGIFYLYGAVGLAALLLFLLYFGYLIVRALLTDFRKYFTPEAGAFGISLCLLLVHVYCTAGVLRRPNASFYLCAALAAVYYFVKLRKYPKRRKRQPKDIRGKFTNER